MKALEALFRGGSARIGALAAPALILAILAMMILPLPAFVLDVLFTFNIALGVVVLFAAIYTVRPLEFAAFPAVLLVTTLLRLSLNVASTRVVLLEGHTGTDAAGKVIEAFGRFVVGGNFAVGLIVFAILVVINFVVITKGAGRIAEVAARFTLDAMPGKQMAIDADLNAGLIGEAEAKRRRREIAEEADFYGSMDGASKFVRGDAVAGILILFINVIGGLVIGLAQHRLTLAQAADNYVLLAIGDGLVAQIPALVISIAAGLIVSRVGREQDLGSQILSQLTAAPMVLWTAAGIVALLGIIPGMPNVIFLLIAAGLAGLAWRLGRRAIAATPKAEAPAPVPAEQVDVSWDDLVPVDVLGLEVGFRLIPLVDRAQDGELLKKIKAIRRKFAQELGFVSPPVHIRDNLELRPNQYRILLKGSTVGEGEAVSGMYLAINPGAVQGSLPGTPTRDPAFGLPAVWVEPSQRDAAQAAGYTVVDATTVVATHLNTLMQQHAAELLGRAETQALIDHCNKAAPKLVDDLVPKLIPLGVLQRVLRGLLAEGLNIRDLRTIFETLAEHSGRTQDPAELAAAVRVALGPTIVQQVFGTTPELRVLVLEPELERVLHSAAATQGEAAPIEPGLADTLLREATQAAARQEESGEPAALLVPDRLRLPLSRLVRRALPRLHVLAHSEIPETKSVRVQHVLGAVR